MNPPLPPRENPTDPRPLAGDGASLLSRRISQVLDTFLKIPGTTARIGLDPIIGLIPGVGDAISTFMGSVILAEALRKGVPGFLLIRLGGNMLLNASIGAIPIVGDLFSAWFKSNSRNYELLNSWLAGNPTPPATPQSRWVMVGFVVFTGILIGLCVLAFQLLIYLYQAITREGS